MTGQIIADQGSGQTGPIPPAGGFICIQSTASITNQTISSSATAAGRNSYVYIPVSTAAATNWVGAPAPAYTGVGTPIIWNDTAFQLSVWSSSKGSWMTLIATTSMSAGGFTTSA
jgi:hypothetical protein